MLRPASWILPLALVTLLHGSPGTSGAAQSRPKEVRTRIGMRLVEILGGRFDLHPGARGPALAYPLVEAAEARVVSDLQRPRDLHGVLEFVGERRDQIDLQAGQTDGHAHVP